MLLTTLAVDTAACCSPPPDRDAGVADPPLSGVSEQALRALRPTAATAREKRGRFANTVAPQDDSERLVQANNRAQGLAPGNYVYRVTYG